MAVNILGLVVLLVFYITILVVGVVAARCRKSTKRVTALESSIVAGRDLNTVVGVFTMAATVVGGGYINGSTESIATSGLVWTLSPFGIFIGLSIGAVMFAKRMRSQNYLTMLDPLQEVYNSLVVFMVASLCGDVFWTASILSALGSWFMVYLASLCGDVFWTASILSALGTSLSVIVDIPLTAAIITSSAITVCYTMIGQMISVAYTDIVQLIFITFGLFLSLPFLFIDDRVGSIGETTEIWVGKFDKGFASAWTDLFIAMIFGTIPWQSYFQRVLSVRSGTQAMILSVIGAVISLILVTPAILIGAVATSADWNATRLGTSPMEQGRGSMVLPLVLQNFTPNAVAVFGLGAISAAVMSSMDSSILGSSSMFTYNVYANIFRRKASESELLWIQRGSIFVIGVLATLISIFVPVIFGLFVLAADVVFVIVLPQLISSVYFKWTNSYGAAVGYLVGVFLRIGSGEPLMNLPTLLYFPEYDEETGHNFPFRTFAMVTSLFVIVVVSIVTNFIKSRFSKSNYSFSKSDIYMISNELDHAK